MSDTELNYIFCVVLGFVLVGLFTLILCWYWSVWGDKFLALKCRLTGHDWAYAEGRAKGALTGKPRPLCFRRACTKCGKIEEISHYSWLPHYIGRDGVEYRQKPIWVTPEDAV